MIQYVVTGLAAGALYALLGLGIVLTFRSTSTLNFAQGEMSMLMAFIGYAWLAQAGVPLIPAAILTFLCAAAFGTAVYNLVIFPNRTRDYESLAIITVGVKLALTGVVAWIFGSASRIFPPVLNATSYTTLGVTIGAAQAWTIAVSVVCMAATACFLSFTPLGLAMRAAAEDVNVAQLLGVNLRVIGSLAWIAAAALGAITGVLFANTVPLGPYMMGLVILKAFAAVVVGGMTSVPGVIVGGFIVGVLEALVAYAFDPLYQESVALCLIIVILLVRPQGLFGHRVLWRA